MSSPERDPSLGCPPHGESVRAHEQARFKATLELHLSRERCTELLLDLVRIPSPQTELLEAEPQLRHFIETGVAPRLRALGAQKLRYDKMGNLIAQFGNDAGERSVMLVTHAMNQPPATMANPYAGEVIDGSPWGLPGRAVRGRGASEQKGTMAAMLHALEAVKRAGIELHGRLTFVCCVSGETGREDAIRQVVDGEGVRADLAIVYGNGLKLQLGNRGRIDVTVSVHGKPSHSSRPAEGCNAITGAIEVARLLTSEIRFPGEHPQLGKAALTLNRIRSFPDATHTVQARCDISVDRRLLPGEDPLQAADDIERVAMRVHGATDPISGKPLQVTVERGPFMHPSLVTHDSLAVKEITKACRNMLGYVPDTTFGMSAFDQGYLNHVGIPTINFGPGEENLAHTDNDMASVERTFDAARVFACLIADYLANPRGHKMISGDFTRDSIGATRKAEDGARNS